MSTPQQQRVTKLLSALFDYDQKHISTFSGAVRRANELRYPASLDREMNLNNIRFILDKREPLLAAIPQASEEMLSYMEKDLLSTLQYIGYTTANQSDNPLEFTDPDGRLDEEAIIGLDTDENFSGNDRAYNNRTLTPKEIGNIIFNETRSLSGDDIQTARENIAHAIINGDEKWGKNRQKYAGSAPTTVTEKAIKQDPEAYASSLKAAEKAFSEHTKKDPTNGAEHFNFRLNDSIKDFFGAKIQTQVGPLKNSYPTDALPKDGVYANTYKLK